MRHVQDNSISKRIVGLNHSAPAMTPLRALTYFDEIDFNESIIMTNTDIDWDTIAESLIEMTGNPSIVFEEQLTIDQGYSY